MDFSVDAETQQLLADLDEFIDDEIQPLQQEHQRFFDHRREDARTNWDDGTPTAEWIALRQEMRDRSDEAGFHRLPLPEELDGADLDLLSLVMAWEHLAERGPGLHNIVGTAWRQVIGEFRNVNILNKYGSDTQRELVEDAITGDLTLAFALSEPDHGSDATTHMDTTARKDGNEWVIDGGKRWIGHMDEAEYAFVFARTAGDDGDHQGITTFLVPTNTPGFEVERFHWMMLMPTTQGEVVLDDVRVPDSAVVGEIGNGLRQVQEFLYPGRLRQAALVLGSAQYCIDRSVEYANERQTWDEPLSKRQAIQFPLVDLQAEAEMVRNLLYKTAWSLDRTEEYHQVRDMVAMTNYRATQLACDAADMAIQVHGGRGYSRNEPFEQIYRLVRRYRITEGAEEIQKRIVGGHLFGFV